jgi:hypothetical protein
VKTKIPIVLEAGEVLRHGRLIKREGKKGGTCQEKYKIREINKTTTKKQGDRLQGYINSVTVNAEVMSEWTRERGESFEIRSREKTISSRREESSQSEGSISFLFGTNIFFFLSKLFVWSIGWCRQERVGWKKQSVYGTEGMDG